MKIKYLSILPVIAVFVLSGFSFAHAQSDVFTQNLYYGLQNNSQVTQLQEFLTSQNLYSGPITGNFYFLTLGAVKAFQTQQGVTPAAGYFGPITMAAANKIADAEVSASNNEAITETGTSTPSITSSPASSTARSELAALTQELALLEQQLQAQQSSTQVLQQIAQNTTPIAIVPTPTPTQPQTFTPAPTASITVNGSANLISIPYDTATMVSWTSTNANSCNVSPMGWTGISSNQSTGDLTASQTYTLSCSGAGGSTSASITVNVAAAPTLNNIQLSGTNDGTNQYYTGVLATNSCLTLFDQYGNQIKNASATITTDSLAGQVDSNKNPVNAITKASGPSYCFFYFPPADGQHTITVSALGSTQSVTVTSVQPPTQILTVTANQSLSTSNFIPLNTIMPLDALTLLDNGNYCYKIADCAVGNILGMFQFTDNGAAGNVVIKSITINDSVTPNNAPPLTNLSLYNGNPLIGSGELVANAGAPVPTSNGYSYTFQLGTSNLASLTLTGVVPSDSSENGSVHVFSISNASSVTAQWGFPATSLTIDVSGATGSPQTVVSTSTAQ